MVDLRARRAQEASREEEAPTLREVDTITPPSRDLMDALQEAFPLYLPARGHTAVVADQVAEQRGEQAVIQFLQNIINAQTQKETR